MWQAGHTGVCERSEIAIEGRGMASGAERGKSILDPLRPMGEAGIAKGVGLAQRSTWTFK